jgi:hypothetical protein
MLLQNRDPERGRGSSHPDQIEVAFGPDPPGPDQQLRTFDGSAPTISAHIIEFADSPERRFS